MKNNNLKIIACVSIMAALAVVLKSFGIMIGDSMRISFFAVPLMIAGLIGGFGWGMVAALAADMIYGFFFNPFGFNPIYTISALLWGVVGGVLRVYSKKHNKLPWLFLIGVILISTPSLPFDTPNERTILNFPSLSTAVISSGNANCNTDGFSFVI